jgi:hypothetical protein
MDRLKPVLLIVVLGYSVFAAELLESRESLVPNEKPVLR